jgi:hypothetical protein
MGPGGSDGPGRMGWAREDGMGPGGWDGPGRMGWARADGMGVKAHLSTVSVMGTFRGSGRGTHKPITRGSR